MEDDLLAIDDMSHQIHDKFAILPHGIYTPQVQIHNKKAGDAGLYLAQSGRISATTSVSSNGIGTRGNSGAGACRDATTFSGTTEVVLTLGGETLDGEGLGTIQGIGINVG